MKLTVTLTMVFADGLKPQMMEVSTGSWAAITHQVAGKTITTLVLERAFQRRVPMVSSSKIKQT